MLAEVVDIVTMTDEVGAVDSKILYEPVCPS